MEHLTTSDHRLLSESNKHISSSVATTVVLNTTNPKIECCLSNVSDETIREDSLEQNHQLSTNKRAFEEHQPKILMKRTSIVDSFNCKNMNDSYCSGQRPLITSGDIEALTLRQFRMGSLGY